MVRAVTLLLAAWLLAGCEPELLRVEVPVAVPCPAPAPVVRPHLPIGDLVPEDPPDRVMRAYAASVEACTIYAEQLEDMLEGYR